MNVQECDVLRTLMEEPFVSQRMLAEKTGHSLGVINRSINSLIKEGYLDREVRPTAAAAQLLEQRAPRSAVILAAGFGMRMVPINTLTPKGLLEIHGEPLIERLIRQLREAGIREISVVVGFMKERFDYLIDEYGVELIVNPEYAVKNNLYSLALAADRLSNTYIVPCDLWFESNPFCSREMYSWYMVNDIADSASTVRVNRKMELVLFPGKGGGNGMVGVAYLLEKDSEILRRRIRALVEEGGHDDEFWESALCEDGRMLVRARIIHAPEVVEINTYEELRELDSRSGHLQSDALNVIAETFRASTDEIVDIAVLKKGMTNRSFLFSLRGEKYIMRIPGEGTGQLINRRQEAEVYRAISGRGLCDDPVYINPENGYKITRFLPGVRTADPGSVPDLRRCMDLLRTFHGMKIEVDHDFDIFGQIDFYEALWEGQPSIYRDYKRTKANVLSLREYIDRMEKERVLTHIDAVPDNFLFYSKDGDPENEMLQLTDWEYAGMQDPHVDIAMFIIYSLYGKSEADRLIDLYFEPQGGCPPEVRAKIYCYVAACGLLWSNWCEYKRTLGVEFGEYSLRQYRYAKDFYRFAKEWIK